VNTALDKRVLWCTGMAARLFAGVPARAMPHAWHDLQLTPEALIEARWGRLLQGDPADSAGRSGLDDSGWLSGASGPLSDTASGRGVGFRRGKAERETEGEGGTDAESAVSRRSRVPPWARGGAPAISRSFGNRDPEAGWQSGGPSPAGRWPATGLRARETPGPQASATTGGNPAMAALSSRSATNSTDARVPAAHSELRPEVPSEPQPPRNITRHSATDPAATVTAPWPGAIRAPQDMAAPSAVLASTRLVQGAAGLGRLLALVPRHSPAVAPASTQQDFHSSLAMSAAPAATPATPTTAHAVHAPAHGPAPAAGSAATWQPVAATPLRLGTPVDATPDVDTLLDALVERLRVEYLRHYGSAG